MERIISTEDLEAFYSRPDAEILADPALPGVHGALLTALEKGAVHSAFKNDRGDWQAMLWVKRAIICGFKFSGMRDFPEWPGGARDREAFPPRLLGPGDGVRLVPGGTSLRRGCCLAEDIVIMPPSYINVGASIGPGSMVDSHVLVGSCAQIGARVHLAAGVQIGGVLEPPGARPVVIEDGVFVGGLAGLFEGIVVRENAVIAPGTIISASTPIFDLVRGCEIRGEVPAGALVVPGSRPAHGAEPGRAGIQLYCPCIVKYRDASTDSATMLEEALR